MIQLILTKAAISDSTTTATAIAATVGGWHIGETAATPVPVCINAKDDTEQAHYWDETDCSNPHGGSDQWKEWLHYKKSDVSS